MIKTCLSKRLLNNLTQRCPVGDERFPELSPASVVLQQPDEGGRRAGGPTQVTQLWQTLSVLSDDAHQPVREGGATCTYMSGWQEKELMLRIPAWIEVSLFVPEQHSGPLVAGQGTPDLEAIGSRGGALGNVFIHRTHCAAHWGACKKVKTNLSFVRLLSYDITTRSMQVISVRTIW